MRATNGFEQGSAENAGPFFVSNIILKGEGGDVLRTCMTEDPSGR